MQKKYNLKLHFFPPILEHYAIEDPCFCINNWLTQDSGKEEQKNMMLVSLELIKSISPQWYVYYRTGSITVRGLYFFYTQVLADLIRERILIGPAKIGVFAASIFYIQVKGADCNRERYFIWERTVMEPVRYLYK